jgi:hypothetical protein
MTVLPSEEGEVSISSNLYFMMEVGGKGGAEGF